MRRSLAVASMVLCCSATPTFAGTSEGVVSAIYAHAPNVVLFAVTGGDTGAPACNTANEWALNLDTSMGKAMYSLLLSAASTGKQVLVVGDNTCSAWADRETPSYVRVAY